MRWIIESSLKLRLLMVIIAAAVMFFGVLQLRNMPVDVLPEFAPPMVEIQTEALGLSAAEVEELVTVPLEVKLLNGVAWVDTIFSQSVPSLSSIVLVFEPGTDILDARQMVQERLVSAHALPNVSKPPAMLQPLSSTNRVMMVGLTSEEQSGIDMSVLVRWNIRPRLMGVPGVANVSIWGQRKRQLQVQVDPEELRDAGISLQQVIRSTGNALWVSPLTFLEASTPGSGGFIDTPTQRLTARHVLPILSEEELARVAVEGAPGVTLGDIGDVVEDHQPLIGDAIVNNGPGLLLVVEKFPWADTVEVTEDVEAAMKALQPGLPGVNVDTSLFRPASYVTQSAGNVTLALIIAAILVVVGVVVLQFDWRSALISIITIPVSLVVATLVIFLLGGTLNLMVMAGFLLALAVIIDDAIIDSENMIRRLRQSSASDERSKTAIIMEAAMEMRGPVIYATIIMLAASVPFYFMMGVAGAFLEPVAFAYMVGFLASLGVALVLTPGLGSLLFGYTPTPRGTSPVINALRQGYEVLLSATLRTPVPALVVAVVIAVVGLAMLPLLSQDLVPDLKENDLLIRWEAAPGTSRAAMVRIATEAGHELRAIPGVHNVTSHVGRAVLGDEVSGINSGQMWVSVDTNADYDVTVAAVRGVVNGNPALNRGVNTFIQERVTEVLAGSDKDLVVRVFGDDLDILEAKAAEVQQAMAGVSGVVNAQVEPRDLEPVMEIEVDLDAADAHGIKPGDVRRAAATMVQGIEVGQLFEEQKVFDVVVAGKPNFRENVADVQSMLIETPAGGYVRLNEVASVDIVDSLTNIKRETISRRIDVGADISGRTRGAVIRDVERAIAGVPFPREYHAEVVGAGASQQSARGRVLSITIASIVAIFLLLQAAFGSWRLGAMSFLAIIVAMMGGTVAAVLGGGILSIGSVAGFFALLALAARNIIALIRHYQRLNSEEGMEFGPELVLRGTRERFGSIITTALVVALAVLPFAIFGAAPGHEVAFPLAIVILGGLVTTTLVSLFVIPALYLSLRVARRAEVLTEQEATA
ncbi:MAG: efflux RND transporter permease subunit [Dehalococcoidia bacterium]